MSDIEWYADLDAPVGAWAETKPLELRPCIPPPTGPKLIWFVDAHPGKDHVAPMRNGAYLVWTAPNVWGTRLVFMRYGAVEDCLGAATSHVEAEGLLVLWASEMLKELGK